MKSSSLTTKTIKQERQKAMNRACELTEDKISKSTDTKHEGSPARVVDSM